MAVNLYFLKAPNIEEIFGTFLQFEKLLSSICTIKQNCAGRFGRTVTTETLTAMIGCPKIKLSCNCQGMKKKIYFFFVIVKKMSYVDLNSYGCPCNNLGVPSNRVELVPESFSKGYQSLTHGETIPNNYFGFNQAYFVHEVPVSGYKFMGRKCDGGKLFHLKQHGQ